MSAADHNSISAALRETARALYPVAKEEAAQQSRLLICRALGYTDAAQLILSAYKPFPEEARSQLDAMVARRRAGEPLQYIFGEWGFMGLTFAVRRGALIPRQDTEVLCEHAIELIRQRGYNTLLDMCCGTGCIGLSIAKYTGIRAALADISDSCVALALENARALNVDARVLKSDMFSQVTGAFDVICANPPYIRTAEIARLQVELTYEPLLALAGGADGLDFYRRIAAEFRGFINPGGVLLLEVGCDQAQDVMRLLGGGRVLQDACGNDRVVVLDV